MSWYWRLPLVLALVLTSACTSGGQSPDCPKEGQVLETARLYIEHNATDADTGVHGSFGGEAWSELCIWDPDDQLIMVVDPQGALGDLTVSDLFFESREPPNDEFSMSDLMSAFPEGEYTVGGTDFEGTPRTGVALFTHNVPAESHITDPVLAKDEETAGEATVSPFGVVVTWDPVTELVSGDSLTVTGFEVIVTKVEHDDPNGWSQPIYDVHVGPKATSLSVPEEFLEAGTVYELEVLVLEVSGNQTISAGLFTTE